MFGNHGNNNDDACVGLSNQMTELQVDAFFCEEQGLMGNVVSSECTWL